MAAVSRRVLGFLGLIGLFTLAACNLSNLQAPGLDKDKEAAVKAVFKAMQKGDLAGIQLGAEMQTPEAQAAIPQIFAAIPKGEPTNVRLLSWHSNWSALTGARSEDMETVHQYTFAAARIDVTTVMRRQYPAQGAAGPWILRGFHFEPSAAAAPATPAGKASPPAPAPTPASTPPAAGGASAPATGATPAPTARNDFVEQPQDDGPGGLPMKPAEGASEETYSKANSAGADAVIDKTRH